MFVSGVIATSALIGILVAAFAGALLLVYIDKRFAKDRTH